MNKEMENIIAEYINLPLDTGAWETSLGDIREMTREMRTKGIQGLQRTEDDVLRKAIGERMTRSITWCRGDALQGKQGLLMEGDRQRRQGPRDPGLTEVRSCSNGIGFEYCPSKLIITITLSSRIAWMAIGSASKRAGNYVVYHGSTHTSRSTVHMGGGRMSVEQLGRDKAVQPTAPTDAGSARRQFISLGRRCTETPVIKSRKEALKGTHVLELARRITIVMIAPLISRKMITSVTLTRYVRHTLEGKKKIGAWTVLHVSLRGARENSSPVITTCSAFADRLTSESIRRCMHIPVIKMEKEATLKSNNWTVLANSMRDLELGPLMPITSITITSHIGNHIIWIVSILTIHITGGEIKLTGRATAHADGGSTSELTLTIGKETQLTASVLRRIVNGRITTYAQLCMGTLVIKTPSQDWKGTHVLALT